LSASADGWRRLGVAARLPGYLRDPIGPAEAFTEVAARVGRRGDGLLELARSLLDATASPHSQGLRRAGWDYRRLEGSVAEAGVEATLAALRDDGVRTSLDELTAAAPIRGGIRVATSGTSSGTPTQVAYDWPLFAEEAALECLLLESHGLLDAPSALWQPAPPGVAGIHNVLVHMRFRRPPERWFSQVPARRRDAGVLRYVNGVARTKGMRIPMPETTPFAAASLVAGWLDSARDRAGAAVLKTFASAAVRLAEAALRDGRDLVGCTVFAGGEPLTERRRRFVESTGARVFGRYVATETGFVAGACPASSDPDGMHLYSDRLAVVPAARDGAPSPLLFTTISKTAGIPLLNTDIGDAGHVRPRACGCVLGRAGLATELADVHGHDKISGEGITLPTAALRRALDEVLESVAAAPDSYEIREAGDGHGGTTLVVLLSPDVPIGDADLVNAVLGRLEAHGQPDAVLAARLWREAGSLVVRRGVPTALKARAVVPDARG
jgi:hypothetical protein